MWSWHITEFEGGRPLLEGLALRLPAAPRGYLHQLIHKGKVHGDGLPLTAETVVRAGMCLKLPASARLAELAAAGGLPPDALLYEDATALVVCKPAGLAVHRAVGHDDNLTARVNGFLALRRAGYRASPVHRLDVGTSGPVLFGKGRQATSRYGNLLMAGQFDKGYLALVSGRVPDEGELTTRVPDGGTLRPALTRYRRLAATASLALLELELVTGRPHQARCQLAAAGWPIVGDRRYGGRPWPGLGHPFLHSHRLLLPALDEDRRIVVGCPLPAALAALLAGSGLSLPEGFAGSAEIPAAARQEWL